MLHMLRIAIAGLLVASVVTGALAQTRGTAKKRPQAAPPATAATGQSVRAFQLQPSGRLPATATGAEPGRRADRESAWWHPLPSATARSQQAPQQVEGGRPDRPYLSTDTSSERHMRSILRLAVAVLLVASTANAASAQVKKRSGAAQARAGARRAAGSGAQRAQSAPNLRLGPLWRAAPQPGRGAVQRTPLRAGLRQARLLVRAAQRTATIGCKNMPVMLAAPPRGGYERRRSRPDVPHAAVGCDRLTQSSGSPGSCPQRCRSSVVEHSLGKGEVDSSILSGSTITAPLVVASRVRTTRAA